jgi:hypothetical protein
LDFKTTKFCRDILIGAVTLSVFAAPSALSAAECPQFPQVALWGEYNHDTVRRHVGNNLAGDWSAYADQLKRQLSMLRDMYGRGSGVAVKRDGRTVRLTGDELAAYIRLAEQRLTVVRCLADSETALKFANFSTAAGTPGDQASNPANSPKDKKEIMQRTYVTLPDDLLEKLRKRAVRQSAKEGRQIGISEVVTEILARELRR